MRSTSILILLLLVIPSLAQETYRIEKLSDEDGFPNNDPIGPALQDATGLMWFNRGDALLKYDGYQAIAHPIPFGDSIPQLDSLCPIHLGGQLAWQESEPEHLLINTGVLLSYHIPTGTYSLVEDDQGRQINLACSPLFTTASKRIFFIDQDHVLREYQARDKIIRHSPKGTFRDLKIENLIENQDGNLWVWAYREKEFHFYDLSKKQLIKYDPYHFHALVNSDSVILVDGQYLLYPDLNSSATQPLRKVRLPQELLSHPILDVKLDNKRNIWVTTADGFSYCYDLLPRQWTRYDDGIFMTHFEDSGEVIWVEKLNRGVRQVIPLQRAKGPGAYLEPYRMMLTNLSKFDGKLRNMVDLPYQDGQTVVMGHKDKFFRIDFALSDYGAAFKNEFSYYLEGYDDVWSESSTSHIARYSNIPAGQYIFRAKGKSPEGEWVPHQLAVPVLVLRAWYTRWWAIGLFISLITGLLWLFINRREQFFKKENEKLERMVKERTDEVVQQKNRAEQSEKFKQQFLANMSHEIRTPMNAILGMSGLVLGTPLNKQQKNYINAIKHASENLLVIINDILDLSKLEAGKMDLEVIPFRIQDVVQQVWETLHFKAEEKNLLLRTEIDERIPEVVMGDPARLSQILINLAGNAIKFTAQGFVSIKVEPHIHLEDAVHFHVIDTGIGIPSNKLEILFQSFQQADTSISRKYGGTGLGLTISKNLVELHNGKIFLKSEVNKGSEFSFFIPYKSASADQLIEREQAINFDQAALDGIRILVAEDNEYNQIVVRDTLVSSINNLYIDIAENGEVALEKLRQSTYDVILMDVHMPVLSGLDTCTRIREDFAPPKRDIPIIALTASVLPQDIRQTQACGMNDHVAKPFSREALLLALSKYYSNPDGQVKKDHAGTQNTMRTLPPQQENVSDLRFLRQFTEGNEERIEKYIKLFLKLTPKHLEKVETALQEKNYDEVATHIHAIKPQLNYMGLRDAKELAQQAEDLARAGEELDRIPDLFGQIQADCSKAFEELAKVLR